MPEDAANGERDADPDGSTARDGHDDRRVAPYSEETTASIDPVEPRERDDDPTDPDVPEETLAEAERLTRLARRVPDDAEAAAYRERRADLLAEHDYAALVREESSAPAAGGAGEPTLVCHPAEWLDDEGSIDPTLIDDVGRAAEVHLGTAGDPDAWDAVAGDNEAVVEQVRAAHGEVHAANAAAFATYVSNHHAKPIAALTAAELRWFREEYYPRNVWPSEEERATLDRSLALVYDVLDVPMPRDATREEARESTPGRAKTAGTEMVDAASADERTEEAETDDAG